MKDQKRTDARTEGSGAGLAAGRGAGDDRARLATLYGERKIKKCGLKNRACKHKRFVRGSRCVLSDMKVTRSSCGDSRRRKASLVLTDPVTPPLHLVVAPSDPGQLHLGYIQAQINHAVEPAINFRPSRLRIGHQARNVP
ncbi:hypothetical protein PoB_003028100 [Plakobranchus ocellatus]|uniref:Uncharacterized protein n=1 Tax=Plakobranchus ocellatus TaxID=259542 RepID=A0AAV3ZXU7_9GAST|nr:hypothetical protein PoB_003028100 [Plakobranchus ocellatus]